MVKKPLALDRKYQKKIVALKPHLLDAVHTVLRSHGVGAVVHSISFRPMKAKALELGPCGDEPCCYVDGVWTCSGSD